MTATGGFAAGMSREVGVFRYNIGAPATGSSAVWPAPERRYGIPSGPPP